MLRIKYENPMERAYQFEYSLYRQVSDLFCKTRCRSKVADRLYLYYREAGTRHIDPVISGMIRRDLVGNITFPMMHECQAEVHIRLLENGLHEFVFTDEVYAFSVSLKMTRHYREVSGIEVRDLKKTCSSQVSVG